MCCEVLEVTFRLWKYKNLVLYIYIRVFICIYVYIYIRIYVVVSKLGTPESRGASSFSTMKSNCNLGMQHFFQTNTC